MDCIVMTNNGSVLMGVETEMTIYIFEGIL